MAVFVAVRFVPGIHAQGMDWITVAVLGLILGLLNALVRPQIFLTLGLFTLVITTGIFWLAGHVGAQLGFTTGGILDRIARGELSAEEGLAAMA